MRDAFFKDNHKRDKTYKNKNTYFRKNKKTNISRKLNPFKLKKKKFKKNIKNVEYYNYYKFDYLSITYPILKADNLNHILIDSIGNIDIYAVESSGKGKFSSKTF